VYTTILFIVYKLTDEIIEKNKLANYFANKKNVCHAPFISLNFDSSGIVTACCANRSHILGKYPENTISEIWYGEKIKELRAALNNFDFSKGCELCFNRIKEGALQNSRLKGYDVQLDTNIMPVMMEIEISTICNYECIMCGGKWSSSIRKNREKLPPLPTPYDEKFVDDIRPYARTLKYIKLLGGEPFAAPVYYKIIDMLYEVNKDIDIVITTNGSIFNDRIKNILKRGQRIDLCLSIDSLNSETYKFIRKNGDLENVLSNVEIIKDIEKEIHHGILKAIAFCPMIQNWREIPDIIQYCKQNNGLMLCLNHVTGPLGGRIQGLHETAVEKRSEIYNSVANQKIFNTVVLDQQIPEVSLFTLPKEEQYEIAMFLKDAIKNEHDTYKAPVQGLINSLLGI
jgi:MoaA/NifB/PqqE/SkfB family radical SAM enzyme